MRSEGFTLLEVLVAIAIMGVIMVLVQATTSQILDAKDRIEGRDMLFQSGRVALRKVSDDVAVAFLAKVAKTGAPAVRTVPSQVTFFIGEDRGDRDAVRFTTLSHLRLYRNARESDQTRVKYEVVPSPEDARTFNLVRTEVPWLDDKTDVDGKAFVLAEGIREFNVEYYDMRKEEWVREWDTEKIDWRERLPSAVRVTISFPDPDDEDLSVTMSTGVFLTLSAGPLAL